MKSCLESTGLLRRWCKPSQRYVVMTIVLVVVAFNNSFSQVLPAPPTITSQPSSPFNVCRGTTGILNVSASGFALSYQWYITPFACEFCETPLSNGGAYSGVNTASLNILSGSLTAGSSYYYFCRVSNSGGAVWTNTIQVNVLAAPTSAPSVTGASSCFPASLTLSASGASPTGGQNYRWFTSATGSAIGGQTSSTYTTPTLSTTTTYYAAIANLSNGCVGPRAAVVASINTAPTPTVTDGSSCGPGTVVLSASGGLSGQYRWYTTPTGTAIPGQTNSTYTTPTLTTSTTYYVSINNGSCESSRVAVEAVVNSVPSAPSTTGNSSCGSAALSLSASGGSAGQYRWYTVSSGGTAIAGETSNTYTTPTLTTSTTYYVSINNGICESSRTSVTATINTIPSAPSTAGNSSCGSAALSLTASGGSAGQYRWYTVSSGGTAIAGQTSNSYTTPTLTTSTTYYVSINNGICESSRTSVTATINTIPSAPSTAGNSSCGSAALTLSASGGSAGQYRWYTVSSGGTAIAGQTSSSYTTPTLTTSTTYYVSINNGICESSRTSVTATINTIPSAPSTAGNSSCGSAALTLTASGGSAGQYRWYTVSSGGTAIAGETGSSYTTPTLTTSTTYYVSINNGICESSRTSVTATINTIPSAPSTTGNSSCGSAALSLTASGGSAGQYRWYTVSSGGTAIAGQTSSSYTTPTLTTSTTYYVSINNGICESSRTSVTATINTIPSAPSTAGNSSCGSAALTLTASGGSAGQYRWYTVSSGGTAIAGQTSNSYTTPTLTTSTTYYVSINNGICESSRTSVTATINTIPSAPSTTGNSSCGSAALSLSASGGSAGQYRWYTVSSGGTAIAGETGSSYTTPTLTTSTTYYVSINNGICESSRTSVEAQIQSTLLAPAVTDGSSCGEGSVSLLASGGTDGQYRWYSTASAGTPIAGATNSSFFTPALTATTTYYVSINNGACESQRQAVVAHIESIPSSPSTSGASGCGPATLTLTATGGSAGQYRWYTDASGGSALGETGNSLTTPQLSSSTTYYVAINNGTCESARTSVDAVINPIPAVPTTTGASGCDQPLVLTASGGSEGEYRWYNSPSGGTAIDGQVGSSYTVSITATTTFYVSVNNGSCESARTPVTATQSPQCNEPPVIEAVEEATAIGSELSLDLTSLISDPNDNLDLSTLKIVKQPKSGATASIQNGVLIVNYKGISFSGTDEITIRVCDVANACSEQILFIEVAGSVNVYNAISPNGDGLNDFLVLENIESLPETRNNIVTIYNRWGDELARIHNYNNTTNVFDGTSSGGKQLTPGTYFYKITLPSGSTMTGYFVMR